MALIRSVRGFTPIIGKDTFLADNATIVGDVIIGDGCSIWFGTILRGDVNSIRIGNGVNIQDGSVLHTLYEKSTIEIGDDVSIGHNVTIHGAKICHGALIGMGSVVMDHAVIGEGAIVAAGGCDRSCCGAGDSSISSNRLPRFMAFFCCSSISSIFFWSCGLA